LTIDVIGFFIITITEGPNQRTGARKDLKFSLEILKNFEIFKELLLTRPSRAGLIDTSLSPSEEPYCQTYDGSFGDADDRQHRH